MTFMAVIIWQKWASPRCRNYPFIDPLCKAAVEQQPAEIQRDINNILYWDYSNIHVSSEHFFDGVYLSPPYVPSSGEKKNILLKRSILSVTSTLNFIDKRWCGCIGTPPIVNCHFSGGSRGVRLSLRLYDGAFNFIERD